MGSFPHKVGGRAKTLDCLTERVKEGNDCIFTGTGKNLIYGQKGDDKIINAGGTNQIEAVRTTTASSAAPAMIRSQVTTAMIFISLLADQK